MANDDNATVSGESTETQHESMLSEPVTATEQPVAEVVEKDLTEKPEVANQSSPEIQEATAAPEPDLNTVLQETRAALEAAQQAADANRDKYLRSQAEFENFRRRAERDIENARKYAVEKFAVELLTVKDSLELALSTTETEKPDLERLKEGLDLTLKILSTAFTKFELCEFNPLGENFDPNLHEAMSMAQSSEYPPNSVMMVFQKGYKLYDRVIRPAKVVVAKAPPDSEQA